ncbi:MAG: SDR family NAD(P)-dependent oxidoreductase, partial [Caldilineaceae bacterium]|nr:SDR family NAD(P)-dependent oxidoreductase [Caldilineaceae bacterium]
MRTILITGATDGIGLALAHLYQREDARLVLIGRRPLSTLTDPLFHRANYCQLDLNDEHCMAALSSWLQEQGIHQLDLVIHNAAIGYVGVPAAQSPANLRAMVQVNLWAPIALSHMLFPLVERARGKLVFISSVATALPSPEYATYTASKAALEGFVRSWQVELAAEQSPVALQIIRPGATRTTMHAKSGANLQKLRPERFPSAATVAGFIASKITHPTRTATVGALNRLIYAVAQTIDGLVDFAWQRLRRRSLALPAGQMTQGERRHCVITGAAEGIGRALAEAFAEAGYIITGIDVDRERAQQLTEAM